MDCLRHHEPNATIAHVHESSEVSRDLVQLRERGLDSQRGHQLAVTAAGG
jgi:hypothetical protein